MCCNFSHYSGEYVLKDLITHVIPDQRLTSEKEKTSILSVKH